MRRIITDFDGVWNPLGYAPDLASMMPYPDMTHGIFWDRDGDRHNVFVSAELMGFLRRIAADPRVELALLSTWNPDIDDDGFTGFGFPSINRLEWSSDQGAPGCSGKVAAALGTPDDRPTLWMEDELTHADLMDLDEGNLRRQHPIRLLATTGWKGLTRQDVQRIQEFLMA